MRILFISIDRARDTRPELQRYVSVFAPETVGLTGTKAEIDAAVAAFRARYSVEGTGADTRVSHTGMVYLIDRHGKLAKLLPPATNPKRYAEELRRLVEAR